MNEKHLEGDLFRTVEVHGKIFNIYYGYYEEADRHSRYNDPVPVYPDLDRNPQHDGEGHHIVTRMQVACPYYSGKPSEDSCEHCPYFKHSGDLFGICLCEQNKKNE